jgi:flagellin
MISGINSSSLSLAMRAAERANKTIDKMATQIATGKKVASVKDDGAAYARVAAMKSQQTEIEARSNVTAMLRVASQEQVEGEKAIVDLYDRIAETILSAKSYAAGSDARKALQKEFEALISQVEMPFSTDSNLSTAYGNWGSAGWGIKPHSSDTSLSQNAIWYLPSIGAAWSTYSTNGTQFKLNDITNANDIYLNNMLASARNVKSFYTESYMPWATADQKILDSIDKWDSISSQNIESSISTLTDADMGNTSRDYDLAQTRQNLAYQTVRNSLSHYGNVAGGLLNNVLGTQRSVRA